MNIAVIGAGMVGKLIAVELSKYHQVYAIDNNSNKNWFNEHIGKEQPHNFYLAKVIKLDEVRGRADIEVLKDKDVVQGHLLNINWARKSLGNGYLGPKINNPSEIFNQNDIIHVSVNKGNLYNSL